MKENKFLSCIGVIAISFIIIVLGLLLKGYVFSNIWGWFIVPIFELPSLSIFQSLGVSLLFSVVSANLGEGKKKDEDNFELYGRAIAVNIIVPLYILFLGWVIVQFT